MSWRDEARTDLEELGARRFWTEWRAAGPDLREQAYALGRFTPEARRVLDRYLIQQAPRGMAWTGAVLAVHLLPSWAPGASALPRTPWIGAVCIAPLRLILGVDHALTPDVIAHELAHAIFPRLSRRARREFPLALEDLEARCPALTPWLDAALAGYRDRRSPDECHVRLLEWFHYGREPLPAELHPFYEGWVELRAQGG